MASDEKIYAPSCIIGGEKISADNTADVVNPATAQAFAHYPVSSTEQVDAAVAAARAAFPAWSQRSIDDRAALVVAVADVLESNKEDIAALTVAEQGKPMQQAIGEVMGACAWARATSTFRPETDVIQDDKSSFVEVHYKPLGVVASITPWNHPIIIAAWHVMPALVAGDTVVIKPSELTPLGTLRAIELIAGLLPPGVVNSVAGAGEVGARLTNHDDVDKVVFTGSTDTGRNIMGSAAPTLKRLTLELGGNDAAIVLADANVDAIVDDIFAKAFGNLGQTCAALKRLYVPSNLHDEIAAGLVARAEAAVVGPGTEDGVMFGPLQNKAQFDYVRELADDTIANGGDFAVGGAPLDRTGYFFPLSVAINVTNGMRVVDEEQFGPILPIIRYDDVEDALRMANECENGLGGSVWTSDEERGIELARRLDCGTAWVNTHSDIAPHIPFGGAKQSGLGVEFGKWGLAEYLQLQALHVSRKGRDRQS